MSSARRDAFEAARLATTGRVTEAAALLKRTIGEASKQGKPQLAPDGGMSLLPNAVQGLLDRFGIGELSPRRAWSSPGPTAQPSSRSEQGEFLLRNVSNGAGSRPYKLYVPTGYRGSPLPLIVMLHGCTQTPDDFAAGTRMNAAAEAENCFVAYPGQTAAANQSKCWNWFNPDDQRRDRGEPSLIADMTYQIMRDYAIDPRRVYIAGLSAGGAAAAIMGSAYPELYAAIGVHSGLACGAAHDVASAFMAMRKGGSAPMRGRSLAADGADDFVPTIVFHGDRDTTVHPTNGEDVVAQLLQAQSAKPQRIVEEGRVPGGHSFTRIVFRGSDGISVSEQWIVHGAGHSWSGGSPAGSYTDPSGPDATREMLRFFLEHPRAVP